MSATGVDILDHTIQETNIWLNAVMRQLETDDRRLACTALRATLYALRDRLRPRSDVPSISGVVSSLDSRSE